MMSDKIAPTASGPQLVASGFDVRPADASDRGAAARLLGRFLEERGVASTPDDVAKAVEIALQPRAAAWLVMASRGGVAVGVCLANFVVDPARGAVLRIESLYVAPQHRRHGAGSALLEHVVREARAVGVARVEIDVFPERELPAALIERVGMRAVTGRRYVTS